MQANKRHSVQQSMHAGEGREARAEVAGRAVRILERSLGAEHAGTRRAAALARPGL